MKDLMAAHNYIKDASFVQPSKIGVIGFCWGGGQTFSFTTQSKDLAATVIYYGPIPQNLDAVKNISAPVFLGNYGELDKPISSQSAKARGGKEKYGKSYVADKIYPDLLHTFFSDVRGIATVQRRRRMLGAGRWSSSRKIARIALRSQDMVTRRDFFAKSGSLRQD